jgi:hypothetical protein
MYLYGQADNFLGQRISLDVISGLTHCAMSMTSLCGAFDCIYCAKRKASYSAQLLCVLCVSVVNFPLVSLIT